MTFLENIQRHGLTSEQHRQMILDQGGLCAVCGRYDALVIDHDHRCCPGKTSCGDCVRGLLCHGCNTALGLMKDDPEAVARMLDYLVRQPERKPRPPAGCSVPNAQVSRVEEEITDALYAHPGAMGISQLARVLGRSKSGVHQTIHSMQARDLVELTPHGWGIKT